MFHHVTLDEARHLGIRRRHDLVQLLNEGHLQPTVDPSFDHFQSYESATDNNGPQWFGHALVTRRVVHAGRLHGGAFQPLAHMSRIRYRAHRKDSW
jgi:hypothetical protein